MSRNLRRIFGAGLLLVSTLLPLAAANYLFFFEAQFLTGYSFSEKRFVFSSHHDMEAMQKPSLGFDYLQRFSASGRDIALLSVQARLAYAPDRPAGMEMQLYNAYLRLKGRTADIWIGHDRPAFGLAAVIDQHGLLLQSLTMNGIAFDRDWGAGIDWKPSWGGARLSLTTGSGQTLRFHGNYLLTGRVSRGVPERDNFSCGLSLGIGSTLETMGSHLLQAAPHPFRMAALDATWSANRWENRLELAAGRTHGADRLALLWRCSLGLLAENRLKIEAQPVLLHQRAATRFQVAGGITFLAHPDWTIRAMVFGDLLAPPATPRETRLVLQIYYYKGLRF